MRPHHHSLRYAWQEFLTSYPATHAVTLAYNPQPDAVVSLPRIHKDLDTLAYWVDVALHGRRVIDWPEERRCGFVGFVEHPGSNAHVHMLWRVPTVRQHEFGCTLADVWARLHPPGSSDVKASPDEGWAKYIYKDQMGAALSDPLLFVASRPARS